MPAELHLLACSKNVNLERRSEMFADKEFLSFFNQNRQSGTIQAQ